MNPMHGTVTGCTPPRPVHRPQDDFLASIPNWTQVLGALAKREEDETARVR